MAIGLVGAHRVGKATVAKAAAKKAGIPFVPTNLSAILRREGVDLSKPIDIHRKMEVQQMMLNETVELFRDQWGSFITDRTPLDMLAYVLAEVGPQTPTDASDIILRYANQCFINTNQMFDVILLIQPGITVSEDPDKETAPINMAYIEQLNHIMKGLVHDELVTIKKFMITRQCTDFDKRVNIVNKYAEAVVKARNYIPEGTIIH